MRRGANARLLWKTLFFVFVLAVFAACGGLYLYELSIYELH
jgi:hypothetical protein